MLKKFSSLSRNDRRCCVFRSLLLIVAAHPQKTTSHFHRFCLESVLYTTNVSLRLHCIDCIDISWEISPQLYIWENVSFFAVSPISMIKSQLWSFCVKSVTAPLTSNQVLIAAPFYLPVQLTHCARQATAHRTTVVTNRSLIKVTICFSFLNELQHVWCLLLTGIWCLALKVERIAMWPPGTTQGQHPTQ